jgi:hypothetical protein
MTADEVVAATWKKVEECKQKNLRYSGRRVCLVCSFDTTSNAKQLR